MTVATSTVVGALACQRNSFLKSLEARVVSCKPYEPIMSAKDKQNKNKKKEVPKKEEQELYAVELEDTALFPEGGGQPYDTGRLVLPDRNVEVVKVLRQGLTAVHVTKDKVEPGTLVKSDVDWDRRFDIMQQHTGQHLVSAVFDTFNLETLSWSMGDTINYIELPQRVDEAKLAEASKIINEKIVENIPITVATPDDHGGEIDVSHIPDDYDMSKGVVRIVSIGKMDTNPCCGTHLQSTGQIQAVALLHQTNIRGGNSRLHFACGSRVARLLEKNYLMLKDVCGSQLSCQVEEVGTKVAELNMNYRKVQSRENALLKELASNKASAVFDTLKSKGVAYIYRADNSPEYLTACQKELLTLINGNTESGVNLTDNNTVVFLNGDYKSGTGGMIKIMGPKAEELSKEITKLVKNMKGGGKGPSFQGKVVKYEKGEIERVLDFLEQIEK
ncbi:hypothetical protein ACI3L0_002011 [Candidozyma auris]|uniref:Alanyl-transfer RNA synthetases family profile domain-containing protein n=1 Tax=Candidozyma auris TaxID=498019 RepID=A0A2H0ZNV3_CANAR|nr:hypothetical_protein [[Candida] auris]PIS52320.1 hypothetical protein B9J08_003934 [[Candida] auris]QEO21697.1 hypothetical_protein [[Candida] auris]GBL47806.1 putative alanine--tRNA ligase [[Candida] auris]